MLSPIRLSPITPSPITPSRMNMLRYALATLTSMNASAQTAQTVLGEDATKVSDHVWAIMGFPNVAIVIGQRATLIVDTGLGPRNGATVARAADKLSRNQKLF